MITCAVAAGLPAGWVSGDEVYGINPDLRAQLETLDLPYVLGIGGNCRVTIHGAYGGVWMQADQIAASLAGHSWIRYSAGARAKGVELFRPTHPCQHPGVRFSSICQGGVRLSAAVSTFPPQGPTARTPTETWRQLP
jgi:hypothetical protein